MYRPKNTRERVDCLRREQEKNHEDVMNALRQLREGAPESGRGIIQVPFHGPTLVTREEEMAICDAHLMDIQRQVETPHQDVLLPSSQAMPPNGPAFHASEYGMDYVGM